MGPVFFLADGACSFSRALATCPLCVRVVPLYEASSLDPLFKAELTTKPHDEHHLRCDFMISEEIQEVGKRENVHRSAKQDKHLLTARNQVLEGKLQFLQLEFVEAHTGLVPHSLYPQHSPWF